MKINKVGIIILCAILLVVASYVVIYNKDADANIAPQDSVLSSGESDIELMTRCIDDARDIAHAHSMGLGVDAVVRIACTLYMTRILLSCEE